MLRKNIINQTPVWKTMFEGQGRNVLENLRVEEAIEQLLMYTKAVQEAETVSLLSANGRILAEDMKAERDNPPFDRAPVDGYACKAEDLAGALPEKQVTLKVIREVDAGEYFDGTVQHGEAVRIMTGAAIPAGCNCCVRQENTDYGEDTVQIYKSMEQWEDYCFQGEDFKKGTVLLKKGTKLSFIEIGILASMGVAEVPVIRRARVAVLTTGDEVMKPGEELKLGKIYDCNQSLLAARLMDFGAELTRIDKIPDNPQDMAEAVREAAEVSDLIITTGAVSVGKKDIMHEVVRILGAQRIFWQLEMKPGMPTLFSVYEGTPMLSLSGNPFGAAVSVDLLIRLMIQKLTQDDTLRPVRKKCTLTNDFGKSVGGRRYVRAVTDGETVTIPTKIHSNGILSTMAGCNCLIEMQKGKTGSHAGEEAEVLLL